MDRTPTVSSEAIARFREGVGEYLTADGARRLLETIDSEAVLEEATAEDVPTEEVARIVGRLVGRAVAKEATSYLPLGQVVEATVGRTIGEKIGEGVVRVVIEYGSVAAIVSRVERASDAVGDADLGDRVGRSAVRKRASDLSDRLPDIGNLEPAEGDAATEPDEPVAGVESVRDAEPAPDATSATAIPITDGTVGDEETTDPDG